MEKDHFMVKRSGGADRGERDFTGGNPSYAEVLSFFGRITG